MRAPSSIATIAFAFTLFACAGTRPPEAPKQTVEAEPEPARAEESAATPDRPVAPAEKETPGTLVCRAQNSTGGSTELFLEWSGEEANGVLRETAPSGMVHEKKVRAERQGALVIADDIYEKDLVVHAAVVAERAGKKVMKIEDGWKFCQ